MVVSIYMRVLKRRMNWAYLVHVLVRARGTEPVEAELLVRVLLPAERGHDLDGQGWDTVWDDRQLVVLGLGVEDFHARHRDNASLDALVLSQELDGLQAQRDLRTSGDKSDLGTLSLKSDVTTLDTLLDGAALELWQVLAGKGKDRWRLVGGEGHVVGSRALVAVSWAPDHHVRQSTEVHEGLDRLVSRAVLTETNGVVGGDVDDAVVGEGGETDGTGGVGHEVQEGTTGRDDGAVGGHTVHHTGHGVLTHTVAHVAAAPLANASAWRLEVNSGFPAGVVGASQVGRAGHELRDGVVDSLEDSLRKLTGGHGTVGRLVDRELVLPALWQLAGQTALEVSGKLLMLASVLLEQLVPLLLGSSALGGVLVVLLVNLVWHDEGLVGVEAELLLDLLAVVLLERVAVDTAGALEQGTETDGGGQTDHGRLVLDLLGLLDGVVHALHVVVTILDPLDVPAVGLEALADVLGEGALGVTV